MKFDRLVDWLFEGAAGTPQLGFAGADKRAWCWVPGRNPAKHEAIVRAIRKAPLRGCTQCAYPDPYAPMQEQECEICWVGLDIDAEDNPGVDLMIAAIPASMVRTSCSGRGLHVIYRLLIPVKCHHSQAGRIIKQITAPLVEASGLNVCKADRRMFWLDGGENRILEISPMRLAPDFSITTTPMIQAPEPPAFEASPVIRAWAQRLGLSVKKSTAVYVGDMVKCLRGLGEKVETVSTMSGNGQLNGYVDISPYSISLWSYADGHTIWNYTDVEGLCKP